MDLASGVLRDRSWRWLAVRISGLLSKTPTFTPDGRQLPVTRLGMVLNPPGPARK